MRISDWSSDVCSSDLREIYASSNSLATNSFETGLIKGSGSLQKYPDTIETAKAVNLTLRKATGRTRFELGIFYQDIDDYVFARFVDEDRKSTRLNSSH